MPRRRLSPEDALAQVLRETRLAKGLSQEALAHEAQRHRNYISQLERGMNSPSVKTLFLLARVLETTPSRLLRRVEELLGD